MLTKIQAQERAKRKRNRPGQWAKYHQYSPSAESEITKPWFVPMKPANYSIEDIFNRLFGHLR